MSEKAKASGQSVPKFRFQSEAERIQKSKLRMEKSGEELERASEKLSGQRPVKPRSKRISCACCLLFVNFFCNFI